MLSTSDPSLRQDKLFPENAPKIFKEIEDNHLEAIKAYVTSGGTLQCECTPIGWYQKADLITAAAICNKPEITAYLISEGADVTYKNHQALRCAARSGYSEVLQAILESPKSDPGANGNEAIQMAASHGHLNVVKLLLTQPTVDAAADKNNTLKCAAKNNHLEVVLELLKDPKVDPTAENNYIISFAAESTPQMVKAVLMEIIKRNPNFNIDQNVSQYAKGKATFKAAVAELNAAKKGLTFQFDNYPAAVNEQNQVASHTTESEPKNNRNDL